MLHTLLLALLAAFAPFGHGDQDGCPHQVVKYNAPRATTHQPQPCGGGIRASFQGVQVTTRESECPLFVIIVPGYASTMHQPDSKTYTIPERTLPIQRLDFVCQSRSFLGLIPLGSSCVHISSANAGAVTHYVQRACQVGDAPVADRASVPS